MSWSDALMRLPIVGTRKALEDAQRKLQQQRSEIAGLREDLRRARARADLEKKKRLALERRTSLRQTRRATRAKAPAAEAALFGGNEAQYAFANVISYPKSGRTWFSTLYFHYARFHFAETDLTVEHILPRGFAQKSGWRKHFPTKRVVQANSHKLGNLTFLTAADNQAADTLDWQDKRPIFARSKLVLANRLGVTGDWTAQSITSRTEDLIRILFESWDLKP